MDLEDKARRKKRWRRHKHMAVLSDAVRLQIWRGVMRHWSRNREPVAALKADVRATIDALDVFADSEATAVNNAIPVGPRASLTQSQKAILFALVILARYSPATLRSVVGEVD